MLREGNMGWAVMLLMLFGIVAGPGVAGWSQSGATAPSIVPAPAAASPPPPPSPPAAGESEVLSLLHEALGVPRASTFDELLGSERDARRISTLVVSVPDPRQSLVSFYFDQVVETLVNAAEGVGLAKDRYLFPWRPASTAAMRPADAESQLGPGVMLFRSAAAGAASSTDVEWLVVFLVGESPVLGARDADLDQAFAWAEALASDRRAPLRVLGPFFSGSARSLQGALERRNLEGPQPPAVIVTGTATAASIAAQLAVIGTTFSRTVPLDDELLEFLVCEIQKQHAPDTPRIAMLAEIGTVFGSGLSPSEARPNGAGAASAECESQGLATFRFPLHIAQLQAARQRGPKPADDAVASLRRTLELRIERQEEATVDTPPVFSELTAHESELELRQLLQRICADQTQYLVLAATDPVDVVFLGQEAHKYCPGMALATLGADVLFTHPDLRATFAGALVASPYPLLFETGALTPWRQSTPFASDVAQGFYNAAVAQLGASRPGAAEPPPLLRYRLPAEECPGEEACYGPQLWLTMIANNAYWPLAKRAAQRSRAQSYQPRAAPPAATNESPAGPPRDDFGTRRAHRLRPTGLAAALSGLVLLFATLHFGRSLQDMRVARREARRRRRREARRASGDAKPEPLTPNDLAKLRYTLSVHLALASIIALVLPTVIAITAPERRLAWSAIAYAGALGVGLGGLALLAWVPVVLRGAARLVAGVRGLGVRRRQPGPAPSDDVRALGVQAAATLFSLALMLWLFVAALRWLYTWRALDPTERLHALTRHIDPLGMSPLVPLVYLAAALYLWGAAGLRRVAAEQRFTTRSPFPPDIDGETLQGLTRRLQRIWHGTQFNAELWTLAALALPALYFWRRLLPTFEGDAYDGLLRAGFIVLYGTVAFAGVKFTLTWRLLSRFLRQLAAQPMIDAYDRVALKVAGSFGLQFSARVPDAREFETSAYNCQLLATLAAQIGGSSAPENELFSAAANDLAAASQRLQANVALDSSRSGDGGHDTTAPPRSSSQPKRARDVLVASAASLGSVSSDLQGMVSRTTEPPFVASRADGSLPSSSDQLQAETHTTFFEASATMFSALRQLWQARVRQPLAEKVSARGDMDDLLPGGRHAKLPTAVWFMRGVSEDVFLWTRMAEDFVALRVVTFIHHILFQLRNLLVFALSGALALVLVVASYPLQPSRFVTVFAWFCMLLVILGGLASILFMERNELLSRLGSSGPGRVNLSVPFVGQLVMYVALPTAVVVASVFPEVSELLFSWLEPLARLLP